MEGHTCQKPACTLEGTKKCAKCKVAFYCSRECQVADWKVHKQICKNKVIDAKTRVTGGIFQWILDLVDEMQAANQTSQATSVKSYKCVEIPGKGLGMRATRDIKKGELIIKEKPILKIEAFDRVSDIDGMFRKLSIDDQNKLMSLYDKNSPKTPYGIAKTNGLQAGVGSHTTVVCYEISRFNHSCLPNVAHAFAEPYERIYVTRNIRCGEEICTAYKNPCLETNERRRELRKSFYFTCTCEACLLPENEQAERDRKLRRYRALDEEIGSCFSGLDVALGIQRVNEAITILKELDLLSASGLGRHSYDAFQLSCMKANVKEAKEWARVAYEAGLIENGPNHDVEKKLKLYMQNPRQHRTWNLLLKKY